MITTDQKGNFMNSICGGSSGTKRRGAVLLTTALFVVGAAGCGDSKKDSTAASSTTSTSAKSEASAAEVATGLARIQTIAGEIATSASDKVKAKELDAAIEPVWKTIEDVVKANDEATYIALEDAFSALSDAADATDAAKATESADAVAKAVAAYISKYPG